ncbi:MAG: hypothetical protein ACE5NC_12415 [Anaerolineae bacterium]
MWRYVILIMALVAAGCASGGDFKRPANLYNPSLERFPFHYGTPYIDMFWRCTTPEAGGVGVDGYTATSTNQDEPPQNFGLTLQAFNADGQKLTERFAWGWDLIPDQFDPVPFQVAVPAAAGAVRYDFYYSFYVKDGLSKLSQFGTVKDVCGQRWRRKPGRTVY